MRSSLAVFASCSLFSASAFASIINVPTDHATIQAAIDAAAQQGDEIIIAPGNYFEQIDLEGKEVILRSTDPGNPTIVETTIIHGGNDPDAPGFPQNRGPVVTATSGETVNTKLIGLTITGGAAFPIPVFARNESGELILRDDGTPIDITHSGLKSGGGVRVLGVDLADQVEGALPEEKPSSITIDRCRFVNNSAESSGGGFYSAFTLAPGLISNTQFIGNSTGDTGGGATIWSPHAQLENCLFEDNTAAVRGGALLIAVSAPSQVNQSIFRNNHALNGDGGAVLVRFSNGPLTLTDAVFEDNTASGSGGAINGGGSSDDPLTVINGTFNRNTAGASGGGMNSGGHVRIVDSRFTQNEGGGGGANISGHGTPEIIRTTFDRNISGSSGGGLSIFLGDALISECVFTGNTALNGGGGAQIDGADSTHTVRDSVFDNNSALNGGGLAAPRGTFRVFDSTFINNTCTADGGGLYSIFLNPGSIIDNTRFENNSAGDQGGGVSLIWIDEPPFTTTKLIHILDSDFVDNTAATQGGGLYTSGNRFMAVQNSHFIGNEAFEGAGVFQRGGSVEFGTGGELTFLNCLFQQNSADSGFGSGGAFASERSAEAIHANCVYIQNTAGNGGAIWAADAANTVVNSTFAENSAINGGAFLVLSQFSNAGFKTNLYNVISYNNSAINGNELFRSDNAQLNLANSTFEGGTGAFFLLGGTTLSSTNVLSSDPMFVDPSNGDFSLDPNSLSVDTGLTSLIPLDTFDIDEDGDFVETLLDIDFRGVRRTIGTEVDRGAFEFCLYDFNRSGSVDLFDLLDFLDAAEAGDPTADIDESSVIDATDINNFLIGLQNGDCNPL